MTTYAVEVEGVVRAWLRTQSAVTSAAPGGIFVGTPSTQPAQSWLTLWLVSGPMDPRDVPMMHALLQFDCYAPKRKQAADLATALINTLWPLSMGGTDLAPQVLCGGLSITRNGWAPDTATPNISRYSVDAEFLVIATG